jgi:hypothetical protein
LYLYLYWHIFYENYVLTYYCIPIFTMLLYTDFCTEHHLKYMGYQKGCPIYIVWDSPKRTYFHMCRNIILIVEGFIFGMFCGKQLVAVLLDRSLCTNLMFAVEYWKSKLKAHLFQSWRVRLFSVDCFCVKVYCEICFLGVGKAADCCWILISSLNQITFTHIWYSGIAIINVCHTYQRVLLDV